jgi:hypothetical protein
MFFNNARVDSSTAGMRVSTLSSTAPLVGLGTWNGSANYSLTNGISQNTWYHIVVTIAGGQAAGAAGVETWYINGRVAPSSSLNNGSGVLPGSVTYNLGFGYDGEPSRVAAASRFAMGRVYNRVLTAVEVTQNYSSIRANGNPYIIDSYTLDTLSTAARTSMTGAYSVKRLLSSYSGAVVNIRRSSDNETSNFFADRFGNLTTGENGSGTAYATWIGAATGFVVTWYDQSGNGRNATQATTTAQPTLDIANLRVNFASPTNAFLQIASPGCIPTGDGLYTCVLRHGTITGSGTFFGSGSTTNGVDFNYDIGSTRYWTRWRIASVTSDVASQNGSTGANNTVTYRYTTAGGALASKQFWINGTQRTSQQTSGSSGAARNTSTSINYIGRSLATGSTFYANTQLPFLSIFSTSLTNDDRVIVESQ